MIFVAKEADFSENNIGTTVLDYSAKTKAVLSAFDNNNLTATNKEALDIFIRTIDSGGILDKIKHLYLPVLADNIDSAFINVAVEALTNEIAISAGEAIISNKGVLNAGISSTNQMACPTGVDGFNPSDFHYLAYLTNFDSNEANGLPNFVKQGTADWFWSMQLASGLDYSASSGSKIRYNGDNTSITNIDGGSSVQLAFGAVAQLWGMSMNQPDSNGGIYMKNGGTAERFWTVGDVGYTSGNLTTEIYLSGLNNAYMKLPTGLFSIGNGLSQSELQVYNDAAYSLMVGMGVNNV